MNINIFGFGFFLYIYKKRDEMQVTPTFFVKKRLEFQRATWATGREVEYHRKKLVD